MTEDMSPSPATRVVTRDAVPVLVVALAATAAVVVQFVVVDLFAVFFPLVVVAALPVVVAAAAVVVAPFVAEVPFVVVTLIVVLVLSVAVVAPAVVAALGEVVAALVVSHNHYRPCPLVSERLSPRPQHPCRSFSATTRRRIRFSSVVPTTVPPSPRLGCVCLLKQYRDSSVSSSSPPSQSQTGPGGCH